MRQWMTLKPRTVLKAFDVVTRRLQKGGAKKKAAPAIQRLAPRKEK